MPRITSILVANRGEIAVRVMRSAQSLGYRTVAVYSEADAAAPHVKLADRAVCIGPAPVQQSYLDAEKILAAAKESGADAIHPGYGFLSENAAFAEAVDKAGLSFIGPPASAIAAMGDKAEAKRRMIKAGVPCVPGYQGEDQSEQHYLEAAKEIGFPVMVKAAAGGGGRGMRLVRREKDLRQALASARSEAQAAFGSGDLILEKAILRPRHVEIQVFADAHGTVLHLGERDCSVQRRHQKVIEEAPCPVMTPELRAAMGAAAVDAARSIDYRGAGTVEFLLGEDGAFYFLEMNTRLQVEHPVTELVTGLDLVALQIKVAEGRALGLSQEDVALSGHAIEARLYAEDPAQDFLPQTGPVELWRPASGQGVRVDSGIETGLSVSPFYDPMIAKVMGFGPDRDTARRRLVQALRETTLFGLPHNKRFLIDVLEREAFTEGRATTAFIEEEFTPEQLGDAGFGFEQAAIGALMLFRAARANHMARAVSALGPLTDWSSNAAMASPYRIEAQDAQADPVDIVIAPQGGDRYRASGDGRTLEILVLQSEPGAALLEIEGERHAVVSSLSPAGDLDIDLGARAFRLRNLIGHPQSEEETGGGRVLSPMHGRVIEVAAVAGAKVAKGDRLLVIEAMKMQHEILAEVGGEVVSVACKPEDQVAAEDLLIEIEADEG